MITERRQRLLQLIVDEYIASAQPVSSGAIVQKYRLPFSPATVRNEMVQLEEDGYLGHPHTSAGRVPTPRGYRYYVESLMREEALQETEERTIRYQFSRAEGAVEEWARLAAAVLASRLHTAAVVTSPCSTQARLRWLELVSVHSSLALLVVVLHEARVLQQTMELDRPLRQDQLTALALSLNARFGGRTAAELRQGALGLTGLEADVITTAGRLLESAEGQSLGLSFLEGLRDLLCQPEFAQGERVLALLDLLQGRNLAKVIPIEALGDQEIRIVIGEEHPSDAMHLCSVITARYSGPSGLWGTISVVGPTRMRYPRAVPLVRYMATLMGELLDRYVA